MSGTKTRLAVCAGVLASWAAMGPAKEEILRWVAAANGTVPSGAVAYGREADGRNQFVCRGDLGAGIHLGKIASASSGCSVAYNGRVVTLSTYEVLANPPEKIAKNKLAAEKALVHPGIAIGSPAFVPQSPPVAGGAKRGFDETGQPYVEVRLADGTVKRTQRNGVTLIRPDGTRQFIPPSYVMQNAQPPTPPDLPSDPARGRAWVVQHNEALLDVIRALVHRDETEMKKFGDGESRAAGDDLFKQIAYRTLVAGFLALDR